MPPDRVLVVYYQTGDSPKLDTATGRFMVSVHGFADDAYRESIRVTTRETLRRKVERGEVGGGRVLGYENIGTPGARKRAVNEAEAAIVRRVFELAAEGKGILRIAKALNADGVKNPTGQARRTSSKRSDAWASTGVRAILHRELYRGRVTYGRTRWEDRGETKVKVAVEDASQWITRTDDSLRIVSDALWDAAHRRMAQTHAVHLRRGGGKLGGKPDSGLSSKYLLSGFLGCGVCGGNLIINKKTSQRGPRRLCTRARRSVHAA